MNLLDRTVALARALIPDAKITFLQDCDTGEVCVVQIDGTHPCSSHETTTPSEALYCLHSILEKEVQAMEARCHEILDQPLDAEEE